MCVWVLAVFLHIFDLGTFCQPCCGIALLLVFGTFAVVLVFICLKNTKRENMLTVIHCDYDTYHYECSQDDVVEEVI